MNENLIEWVGKTWKVLEVMLRGADRRFMLEELKAETGLDKSQLSRWLKKLRELGLVESIEPEKGEDQRLKYFKLTWKGNFVGNRILALLLELERVEMKDRRRREVKPEEVKPYIEEGIKVIQTEETEELERFLEVVKTGFGTYLEELGFWNEEFRMFYDKILANFGGAEKAKPRLEPLEIASVKACKKLLGVLIDAAVKGNPDAYSYVVENMDRLFDAVLKLDGDTDLSISNLITVLIKGWRGKSVEVLRGWLERCPSERLVMLMKGIEHMAIELWRVCGIEAEKFFFELLKHENKLVRDFAQEALIKINNQKIHEAPQLEENEQGSEKTL